MTALTRTSKQKLTFSIAALAIAMSGFFALSSPAAANDAKQQLGIGMPAISAPTATTTLTDPTVVATTAPSADVVDQGCSGTLKTADYATIGKSPLSDTAKQPAALATLFGKPTVALSITGKIRTDQTAGAAMTPATSLMTPAPTGHAPTSG